MMLFKVWAESGSATTSILVAAPDKGTAKNAVWEHISSNDACWKMGEPDEEYFEIVRTDVILSDFSEYILAAKGKTNEEIATVRVAEG